MNADLLKELLKKVENGSMTVDDAVDALKELPFEDIGYARIDHHRAIRKSHPEVIYCPGKTASQVSGIAARMLEKGCSVIATRATREVFEEVKLHAEDAEYYDTARIISVKRGKLSIQSGYIAVVTAGTSDIPVAEEAAVTAELMGNKVERIYDAGVAGIHRLFASSGILFKANVLIVVAGMEGALASVVGGLVDRPVIAVPTSVGYGASFGGLAALLAMLNSCSSGIGVVNIDNGFGAGCLASMINRGKS
jgi:pyridinium-3,5-biscarboxylic acid mononucleotide synthase